MRSYIVCLSHMKPSKIKGDLPDIQYKYIANDSHIGIHYTLTDERSNAYVFDESELKHAKFIADCWDMNVKPIENGLKG